MQQRTWRSYLTLICSAALFSCQFSTALADWSDNFDGGLQQFWQFGNVEGSTTFTAGSVNNRLVLTDSRTPANSGALTAFGVVLEEFTDVKVTGLINPDEDININDSVALMVRGNLLDQSFYMAEINYTDQQLIIYRNGGEGGSGNLIEEPIPDLAYSDSLYVEFEAIGDHLEAWAYDAPGGTLRATTSITDAELTSGLSGVLVNESFATLPMLGVWDDVTSTAISMGIPGDFSGSGAVGNDDLTLLLDNWGATVPPTPAGWVNDAPTAPAVGNDDLTRLLDNWGNTALSAAAVPEPSALALSLGLIGLAASGRFRRVR